MFLCSIRSGEDRLDFDVNITVPNITVYMQLQYVLEQFRALQHRNRISPFPESSISVNMATRNTFHFPNPNQNFHYIRDFVFTDLSEHKND